jgi:hypothetical protein
MVSIRRENIHEISLGFIRWPVWNGIKERHNFFYWSALKYQPLPGGRGRSHGCRGQGFVHKKVRNISLFPQFYALHFKPADMTALIAQLARACA